MDENNTSQALAATLNSPEAVSDAMSTAIEAAVRKAVGATAGPIPAFFVNMLLGQIVRPITDTLAAVIQHIGMATPHMLANLVEKLESGVGFDLNGDGYVGDPDRASDAEK